MATRLHSCTVNSVINLFKMSSMIVIVSSALVLRVSDVGMFVGKVKLSEFGLFRTLLS